MQALAQLPPSQGIAAMQGINVAIVNPLFLVVFVGTAVGCVLVVITSLLQPKQPGAIYAMAGAVIYLIGSLAVTAISISQETTCWQQSRQLTWQVRNYGRAICRSGPLGIMCAALRRWSQQPCWQLGCDEAI